MLDMNFRGELTQFEVVGPVKDVRSANVSHVDPSYIYSAGAIESRYNLLIRSRCR